MTNNWTKRITKRNILIVSILSTAILKLFGLTQFKINKISVIMYYKIFYIFEYRKSMNVNLKYIL